MTNPNYPRKGFFIDCHKDILFETYWGGDSEERRVCKGSGPTNIKLIYFMGLY